jgi:hypothetical protein
MTAHISKKCPRNRRIASGSVTIWAFVIALSG